MQTGNNNGIEFAPNLSKKNLRFFYFVFGFFILIGLILMGVGIENSNIRELHLDDKLGAGAGIIAGCTIFLLIIHFLTSPLKVSYYVGKENLILRQNKTTLALPYRDIESLTLLKEKQAEEFILKLQNQLVDRQRGNMDEAMKAKENLNLVDMFQQTANAFKEQTSAFEKYKFLSVPVSYSSSGPQHGPKKASAADLPCETIFILLKNGDGYLISPKDAAGFMAEANKQLHR